MSNEFPVSFEFFPPKTAESRAKLAQVRQSLYALAPEYFSVTYGAGGSTQEGTLATVKAILEDGFDAAPHLCAIGATRAKVREQLASFDRVKVQRLVALRGDLPSGNESLGEFRYASQLVECIRQESGRRFRIEVGCYPEMHPQATSPQADLQAFAAKVRAGADSAITQYFYNAYAYFHFVDEAHSLGVDVPVVPGIMPITNSAQLMRFSDICGAEIPQWLRLRLQAFGDDSASIRAFGLDVTTALCERLRKGGAPGLHFYSMNQSVPSLEICSRLGLVSV